MGAGERVRLNFAGDRLVGLDVSADTIDTLITNNQAIRADGGAILLTAAGAEAVTRSVINNTGVLEATQPHQRRRAHRAHRRQRHQPRRRIDGCGRRQKRGRNHRAGAVRHPAGRWPADRAWCRAERAARSSCSATKSASSTRRRLTPRAQRAAERYWWAAITRARTRMFRMRSAPTSVLDATIKADAVRAGRRRQGGGLGATAIRAITATISARAASRAATAGSSKFPANEDLDFHGAINVARALGIGGHVLLDPQDIVLNTTVAAPPPNNPNGTPDVAFGDPPAVGTTTIQITVYRLLRTVPAGHQRHHRQQPRRHGGQQQHPAWKPTTTSRWSTGPRQPPEAALRLPVRVRSRSRPMPTTAVPGRSQ